MTKRLVCVAAIVAGMLVPLFAATPPSVQLRGETLVVSLPAGLLGRKELRKQLTSGLTTTFAVIAKAGERTGGVRVDIRYEPWEEVYFVTTRGVGTAPQTQRIASLALLEAWWRDTQLAVLPHASGVANVQLTIDVLPFSVEEQQETQRWLTRTLGEARQPAQTEARDDASSVLDVLIGTSIKRRPPQRYRWQVQETR